MRFYYSIASGSKGNCGLYVASGTAILIDAGVSLRRITTALSAIGVPLKSVAALLLTHAHTDHMQGLPMLLRKTALPVYATRETAAELAMKLPTCELSVLTPGDRLRIGAITAEAFSVPHDAAGCVGYILEASGRRFGYVTDLGFVPTDVAARLRGCDAAVLESNYDPFMLQAGPYPVYIKERIRGPEGHLSNPDCATLAADLAAHGAKTLILAHISETNNVPGMALQQTRLALKGLPVKLYAAPTRCMDAPITLEEGDNRASYTTDLRWSIG